jgi:hypothetical protein
MPYPSVAAAKEAGFPSVLDDTPLTKDQINALAAIYDAVRERGDADEPMAVAIAQWKRGHKVEDGKWVEREMSTELGALTGAPLETEDVPGVEVFRTGTHVDRHGNVFKATAQHVKEIAASMAGLLARGFHSVVQLTHDKSGLTASMPTLGNAENFRVEPTRDGGHVLLADFRRVPKLLADLMRAGGYQSVSPRIVRPYKLGEHVAPWAVEHVAVLGVLHPAVAGLRSLDDVARLYRPAEGAFSELDMEMSLEFEDAGRVEDAPAEPASGKEEGPQMEDVLKAKGLKDEAELDAKLALAGEAETAKAKVAELAAELERRETERIESAAAEFSAANATRLGPKADKARAIFTALSRTAACVEFTACDGTKTSINTAEAFAEIVAGLPEVVPTKEEGTTEFAAPGDGGGDATLEFDGECEHPTEDGVLNADLAKKQAELAPKIMAELSCDMATAMQVALDRLTQKKQTDEQ